MQLLALHLYETFLYLYISLFFFFLLSDFSGLERVSFALIFSAYDVTWNRNVHILRIEATLAML